VSEKDLRAETFLTPALRPAKPEDEDFLLRVFRSTREDELALTAWDDAQKDAFIRMQYAAQQADYMARFPDAEYSVILYGDAPAGRIWIGRSETEIRLLDIALLPGFQNRGIGTYLLNALIAESNRVRKPLRHSVFKFNTDAFSFYQRLGFQMTGESAAYVFLERPPNDPEKPPRPWTHNPVEDRFVVNAVFVLSYRHDKERELPDLRVSEGVHLLRQS
jgi:ribosomal protein S18 acetylase RimI-like enzyme